MIVRFLVRRVLELVVTLLVASFVVFGALQLAPGNPAAFLLNGRSASPQALATIDAEYHLNDPFFIQYGRWLGQVLHGDLGWSIQYRSPVAQLVESRLPTTLLLVAMALLLVLVFSLLLGAWGAVRGGAVDSAILVGTTVAVATPSFVAAIVMLWIFSVDLRWFPALGGGSGLFGMAYHLTLPAIALALYWIGVLARVVRSAMLEELGLEHVTVARSRGIPERQVIWRHAFRNALGAVATMAGLVVSGLVVSTVLVEYAFNVNGLGSLLEREVTVKDFPVVQAVALLIVALFVLVNLVVDLLYPLLDPRVRLGMRSGA